MKEQIERDGLKEFVRLYTKYDCITGDSDRMEFLENKIKEYDEKNFVDIRM